MSTRITLAVVDLVPLSSKMAAVHHSHLVRRCILQLPVGHPVMPAHPIPTAMVEKPQLGMLLHVLQILMGMAEGRQRGMLVLGHLILMQQDQMGVLSVVVLVQVGVVLLPPDLVVGRRRPELHRPLLLLHLHGVHLLRHGVLLREQPRLHGIPVGYVVFNFLI